VSLDFESEDATWRLGTSFRVPEQGNRRIQPMNLEPYMSGISVERILGTAMNAMVGEVGHSSKPST
jgi:hypothetical protein